VSVHAIDHVTLAANNGAIGCGEVMLLRIAEALRELSVSVTVVAPATPGGIADAARQAGFETVQLHVKNRLSWMWQLRRWDSRHRKGMLWCNGLVPATATWGHRARIVHLHQHPDGLHRVLSDLSRVGAVATLVPSAHMLRSVPGARVMPNWTAFMPRAERKAQPDGPFTIGFLGRLGPDKGVHVLAQAMRMLDEQDPGRYRLALAGEPVFVARSKVVQVEEALAAIDSLVDRVGWVKPAEFFDTIDLLVVPSVWEEPFGLVAAEAMSAQVPLLVSDAGALPEIVGRETGMVTPKGDAVALAEKIAAIAQGTTRVDVDRQFVRWSDRYSPRAGVGRVGELLTHLAR